MSCYLQNKLPVAFARWPLSELICPKGTLILVSCLLSTNFAFFSTNLHTQITKLKITLYVSPASLFLSCFSNNNKKCPLNFKTFSPSLVNPLFFLSDRLGATTRYVCGQCGSSLKATVIWLNEVIIRSDQRASSLADVWACQRSARLLAFPLGPALCYEGSRDGGERNREMALL